MKIESLDDFRKRFLKALRDIGFSEYEPAQPIRTDEIDGEPALEIPWGIWVTRRDGKWEVDLETVDPGVRYYPDGSGEPPSSDYETKYLGESALSALAVAVKLYVDQRLANVTELLGEEETAECWP